MAKDENDYWTMVLIVELHTFLARINEVIVSIYVLFSKLTFSPFRKNRPNTERAHICLTDKTLVILTL